MLIVDGKDVINSPNRDTITIKTDDSLSMEEFEAETDTKKLASTQNESNYSSATSTKISSVNYYYSHIINSEKQLNSKATETKINYLIGQTNQNSPITKTSTIVTL